VSYLLAEKLDEPPSEIVPCFMVKAYALVALKDNTTANIGSTILFNIKQPPD
jgi:hypothetical protein